MHSIQEKQAFSILHYCVCLTLLTELSPFDVGIIIVLILQRTTMKHGELSRLFGATQPRSARIKSLVFCWFRCHHLVLAGDRIPLEGFMGGDATIQNIAR